MTGVPCMENTASRQREIDTTVLVNEGGEALAHLLFPPHYYYGTCPPHSRLSVAVSPSLPD